MNNRFNVCLCPVYLAPAVGIWRVHHRKEKLSVAYAQLRTMKCKQTNGIHASD